MGRQGGVRLRGAPGEQALERGVPRRVHPVERQQPDHHRRLGRGPRRQGRRADRPAALQRRPPQARPECSGPLRGQPAQAARPDPRRPVRHRAAGQALGLQGNPGDDAQGAQGAARRSGELGRAAQPRPGGDPQEILHPRRLPGVRSVRPAAGDQQPARGKASGFALSIGVLILYYILLNNGEEYARFGKMPPWLGMWLPNILLAVAGFFLLVRRNRDKSLLVSRIDRWVRQDVWSSIQRLRGLTLARRKERQEKRAERAREREAAEQTRRETHGRRVVLLLPRPRIVFPNILDRYVVRLFTMIFSLVVLSGISLFMIFDLSENIDDILKNKVGTGVVLNYYKYLSLQMFYDIAPIIVLVTTLMTFSLLARTNEITAAKALGLSLYRLALPVLAAALVVTSFSGYLESSVLPASNEKVAKLKDQIRGKATARTYRRADHQWLFGQGGGIYNYPPHHPPPPTPPAPQGLHLPPPPPP